MSARLPESIEDRDDLEALLARATNWEERRVVPPDRPPWRLDRVHEMLTSIGDPHLGVETVHVAGSKGKGSVVRMVAVALQRAGRGPVGLYTSPHLADLTERVAVDGVPTTEAEWAEAATALLPHVARTLDSQTAPTFFELVTGIAWWIFRERGCRSVVLETGLGGRLDATNACAPRVTGITSIEREHTEILGDRIEQIAAEKAGILKAGVRAATSARGVALEVIEARAVEVGAPLEVVGRDVRVGSSVTSPGPVTRVRLEAADATVDLALPIAGAHQGENAALAFLLARAVGVPTTTFVEAMSAITLPGVLEPLPGRAGAPLVVADGAHTPASSRATAEAVRAAWPGRRRVLVTALLQGKDAEGVLGPLLEGAFAVVATTLETPRARSAEEVAAVCRRRTDVPVETAPDVGSALARARDLAGPDGLVLASGSVRLAGRVRAIET